MVSRLGNSRNCQTDQHMTAYISSRALLSITQSAGSPTHLHTCSWPQLRPSSEEMSRGGSAQTRRNRRRGRAGHAGGGLAGTEARAARASVDVDGGAERTVVVVEVPPKEGVCLLPRPAVRWCCVRVWSLVFGPFPRQLRSACITHQISWPITGPVLHVHDKRFCLRWRDLKRSDI
jgi:hypothetical protein